MAGWVTGGYPGGSVQTCAGPDFAWRQQPSRLVLHTTETAGFPNYPSGNAPHVTVNPRARTWRQHRSLDKPAWALAAPVGQVSTNSMGAIQIEIVGYAATVKDLDGADLAYLIGFIRFMLAQTGIPAECSVLFGGSETYGTNGPKRMSPARWTAYRGICGHQHVPGNSHWDPGDLPMQAKWLPLIQGAAPAPTPPPEPEMFDMELISAPTKGAAIIAPGYYLSLTPDQVTGWSAILGHGPKGLTDAQFDAARYSCKQADAWVPPVDVDEEAIATAVAAALAEGGNTITDADTARIATAVVDLLHARTAS